MADAEKVKRDPIATPPQFTFGFAVVDDNRKILIRTVTNTRVGAIVNYLAAVRDMQVTEAHSEQEIEAVWLSVRQGTRIDCVRVTVEVFK